MRFPKSLIGLVTPHSVGRCQPTADRGDGHRQWHRAILTATPSSPRFLAHWARFGDDALSGRITPFVRPYGLPPSSGRKAFSLSVKIEDFATSPKRRGKRTVLVVNGTTLHSETQNAKKSTDFSVDFIVYRLSSAASAVVSSAAAGTSGSLLTVILGNKSFDFDKSVSS